MPTVKEHELRPPTPFAPPPLDEDDDLVFVNEEDPSDRLALGLPVPAKDINPGEQLLEQSEPEQPPDNIPDDIESHDEGPAKPISAEPDLAVVEPDLMPTLNEASPEPSSLADATTEATVQPEIEAFDPELSDAEEAEDDESTVFYDADESYIPQYSSPRHPGTPRSKPGTPLGSLTVKLMKSPRFVTENGSPKLDLHRLSSPTKKRKVKMSVTSGDDMEVEGVRKVSKSSLSGNEVSV